MGRRSIFWAGLALMAATTVYGCASGQPSQSQMSSEASPVSTTAGAGTLEIRANGEDFVRQGFTSKDGWKIVFDHVYVTLADVTAYQTEPPYDAQGNAELKATQQVSLGKTQTVDLAAGDVKAEPVLVGEVKAPAGRYNALAWKMPRATAGEATGSALMLIGKATKARQTIPFTLKVDEEMGYQCGEFVGDQRKGTLKTGDRADLEATFHFDHLFGDANTPATDDLNKGALGFQPLAAIAQTGKVNADMATLKQSLSASDYEKFRALLPSLGHVGEGHCKETTLAKS